MTTALEPTAVLESCPPARTAHRFLPRFIAAFFLGLLAVLSIGVGALYAWGQQYDGRVLPGVRVGSIELGGLTHQQAEAQIASAYGWLANGQIILTGPDGQKATIGYADL